MKKNLFILFLITLILGACSAPNSPDIDNTLPVVKATEAPVTIEAVAPVTIEPNNPLPQMSSANNVALNPPHGAPGHDCNIAVGSPLNGAGKSVNAPAPVTLMPNANLPLKNVSANGVRLNPPHGEPGHDCNVQVGQPLS